MFARQATTRHTPLRVLDSVIETTDGIGVARLSLSVLVLIALYFLPGIVASSRHARSAGPAWVINIFLGWTFVGWVVALAMAFGETRLAPAKQTGYRATGLRDRLAYGVARPEERLRMAESQNGELVTASELTAAQYCPNCGTAAGGANFCPRCGKTLTQHQSAADQLLVASRSETLGSAE